MFGLFKPDKLVISMAGDKHELLKGEAIEAIGEDGSKLLVSRHADGSILIDSFAPKPRTGKRNHR